MSEGKRQGEIWIDLPDPPPTSIGILCVSMRVEKNEGSYQSDTQQTRPTDVW
jgi:hypothetical protein